MRTTLSIDDDVLSAAREIAEAENRSLGEVISSLARRALFPLDSTVVTRNRVPLLPARNETDRVTAELVRKLHDELP